MSLPSAIFELVRYRMGIDVAVDEDIHALACRMDDRIKALTPANVLSWIESNINLEKDKTAWANDFIKLEPYQRAPIEAQVTPGVELVVIIGPEQFGKSMCWKGAALYKMVYYPGPKLIVYEEQRKAGDINKRTFHPLVESVPELARQLELGGWAARKNSYDLQQCVVDFTGAGADITSQAYMDVYADELDTWPLVFDKKLAQLENLRKRRRTFAAQKRGCLSACSSCKGTEDDSAQWQLFLTTNQCYWHLRCMNCGELTIPAHQIDGSRQRRDGQFLGGLQFEVEDHRIIPDTIRLHCGDAKCNHAHTEDQSPAMNAAGDYIATVPEIERQRGYVFGGLSSTRALSWLDIAESRLALHRNNSFEAVRTHHNSVRGVAMPVKRLNTEGRDALMAHCAPEIIKKTQLKACVLTADTQESPFGWYWLVRGVDEHWNSHLLDLGFVDSKEALEDRIFDHYQDHQPRFALIDQGGTNAEDVKDLAARHAEVWQYKGSSRPTTLWKVSQEKGQIKLVLADAGKLQVMLLRQMYDVDDTTNNYMFLPPEKHLPRADDPRFDYLSHMVAVRDLENAKHSHLRQNWNCGSHERRDFFDCEKMALVLLNMPLFRDKLFTPRRKLKLSELQANKKR